MEGKKRKYSNLQKAFWVVSGNEIWIIKESTTTYNYYTSQGLILFMTFLFAAFCGAFAGVEFGSSWVITIIFALVWGLLVYSIDRMMVQSIDKVVVDNYSFRKKFWSIFFPRIFLGILLALFMSSPLDHFLFKEQIEDQMRKNADASWIGYQEELQNAMNIKGTKERQEQYTTSRDSLYTLKGEYPNTIAFKEAKRKYDTELPKLNLLENDITAKRNARNQAWNMIPTEFDSISQKNLPIKSSSQYQFYLEKNREYNNAHTAYNIKQNEIRDLNNIMFDEIRKNEVEITNKIQQQDTLITLVSNKLENDNLLVENKTREKQEFLDKMQGFDTKFMTLLTHPNFGVQFLRWFIFLVFFMIEILPTWMKLMGKPTEYDLKLNLYRLKQIKAMEQEIIQEDGIFEIKKQSELELTIEKEKQRREIELENHKQILNNIADKQNKISISILDEWEEKVKNNSNVDDFINKTN